MARSQVREALGSVALSGFGGCREHSFPRSLHFAGAQFISSTSIIQIRLAFWAIEDQVLGASIMWVMGSLAFLVPAMFIMVRLLRPSQLGSDAIHEDDGAFHPVRLPEKTFGSWLPTNVPSDKRLTEKACDSAPHTLVDSALCSELSAKSQ
jgi:hypothetical protein